MSPEQVESEEGLDYSPKVDTWGLGVVAYELLHDKMPFRLGIQKYLAVTTIFRAGRLLQNPSVTL